ncbi:tape measure protein [Actinotignum sp. GS-2025e]|uniref:tape measure protein n=1 Tax=unclassified Actinotignum TaxID=2632702 RepID=UPI003F44E1B6
MSGKVMEVGKVYAEVVADTSGFDQRIDQAGRKWHAFMNALNKGANGVLATSAGMTTAATSLLTSVTRTGLAYNSLQQNSRAALKSIMGGAQAANAQMDKLDEFARTSPFSKDVFIQAQQTMLGFGIQAEKVLPTLDAIQQAVAAVGGSSNDVGDLAYVLAQISSAGKVTATDLMQLGQRGVDAASMIGDQMGITSGQVREMITAGKISANDFIDLVTTGMATRFAGATANIKAQWTGAADRIKAATRDIGAEIGRVFIDPHGGGALVGWGNQWANVLRSVQAQVKTAMPYIEQRLALPFQTVTLSLERMNNAVQSIDMGRVFDRMGQLREYGPLFAGLAGATAAWSGSLLSTIPIIGSFIPAINPLVGGLGALLIAFPRTRESIKAFADQLRGFMPRLESIGVKVADIAMALVDRLAPAFDAVLRASGDLIGVGLSFADSLLTVVRAITPLVSAAGFLVEAFAKLPTPILAAIVAFRPMASMLSSITKGFSSAAGALSTLALNMSAMGGLETRTSKAMFAVASSTEKAGKRATGLAGKLGALTGIFSPLGLAVGGVSLAFAGFAFAMEEAEARQERVKDSAAGLVETLDQVSGAATRATQSQIAANLEKTVDAGVFKQLQLDAETVADAITGSDAATQKVAAALEARGKQLTAYGTGSGVGAMMETDTPAARELTRAIDEQRDALAGATDAQRENREATERSKMTAEGYVATLKDQKAAQDAIARATMSAVELEGQHAEIVGRAAEALAKYGQQQATSSGYFDANTEAGRAFNKVLNDQAETALRLVESQRKMGKGGAELRATMEAQRNSFIETAVSLGNTSEQAAKLADALGLIPSKVQTDAELHTQSVMDTVKDLKVKIDRIKGTVEIDGDPYPAETKLRDLGFQIDEKTGTVTINGNKYPADLTLEALVLSMNTSEGTVTINGQDIPAKDVLDAYMRAVANSEEFVKINGKDYKAEEVRTALLARVSNNPAWLRILADASDVYNWLGANSGKNLGEAYFNIIKQVQTVDIGSRVAHKNGYAWAQADGGLLEFYARGGIREQHIAQIGRRGDIRVWNEDEAGGEAYIPMSPHKRGRSTRILDEVARRFGYMLIPTYGKAYADGGMNNPPPAPTPTIGGPVRLVVGDREFTAYLEEVADRRVLVGEERSHRWR